MDHPPKQLHAAEPAGGKLDDLTDWLDLPRLVVLDATRLEDCRLPKRPEQADGLLLDRVSGPQHLIRLQTTLESLWGIPVLGGLDALPVARAAVERAAARQHAIARALPDAGR